MPWVFNLKFISQVDHLASACVGEVMIRLRWTRLSSHTHDSDRDRCKFKHSVPIVMSVMSVSVITCANPKQRVLIETNVKESPQSYIHTQMSDCDPCDKG